MREDFYTNFKRRYGFKISGDPIHIDSISVEVFQSENNEIRDKNKQKRLKGFVKKDYPGEVDMGLVSRIAKSKLGN